MNQKNSDDSNKLMVFLNNLDLYDEFNLIDDSLMFGKSTPNDQYN